MSRGAASPLTAIHPSRSPAMPFDPDDPFGPTRPVPPPPGRPAAASAAAAAASPDPDATVRLTPGAPWPGNPGHGGPLPAAPLPPSRAGVFGGFNFDDLPPAADLYVPASAQGGPPRGPAQDGETVRLGAPAAGRSADPDATVRLGAPSGKGRADVEPVVGWLVVASGPARGRDFRLLAGRTTLGRDARMDVALPFDPQVSRERHALVSYDPRANVFRLVPGDGSGLVYLNGTAVDVPTTLAAHDRIEVGQTTLVFVPLCTEAFQWTAP